MSNIFDELKSEILKLSARVARTPEFKWGVVTSSSPLLVRLDGDDEPLAGSPSKLVDALFVGDRVRVEIQFRRATVVGVAKGRGPITFALKSQLDAWSPIDGTHAWVTSEGREYVRAGGAWRVAFEDTGWIRLDGWTGNFAHSSAPVYYRRAAGHVEFKGSLINSSWSGSWTAFGASMPDGFRPTQGTMHTMPMNSTTARAVEFGATGGIRLYGSAASGSWWSFDQVRYSTT